MHCEEGYDSVAGGYCCPKNEVPCGTELILVALLDLGLSSRCYSGLSRVPMERLEVKLPLILPRKGTAGGVTGLTVGGGSCRPADIGRPGVSSDVSLAIGGGVLCRC
jgi:hypothetical protein